MWEEISSSFVTLALEKAKTDEDRIWAILDHDQGHEHLQVDHCDWLVAEFLKLLAMVRAEK